MALSDQIRAQRLAQGLTLAELARRTHVSRSYLSLLENGTDTTLRPPAEILNRIASALGTSVGVFHETPLSRIDGIHEKTLPGDRIDSAIDALVGVLHETPLPRTSEEVIDVLAGPRNDDSTMPA